MCFRHSNTYGDRFLKFAPLACFLYFCNMEIQLEQIGSKGTFYIEKDGKRVAEMVFSKAGGDLIIVEHTEVSDELRGTGAGKKLVQHAVEYARKNHLKILPLCPFTKSVFERTPEFADVWSK